MVDSKKCAFCAQVLPVTWQSMGGFSYGYSWCESCKEFNVHASGDPVKVMQFMQSIEQGFENRKLN